MSKKIDWKILLAEIKQGLREFYPYFFGFYLLSLIVAVFSKTWRGFFYWPAFHIAIIFFGLLFVSTFKFNLSFKRDFRIIGSVKNYLRKSVIRLRRFFIFVRSRLLRIRYRTWLKILLIAAIFVYGISAVQPFL